MNKQSIGESWILNKEYIDEKNIGNYNFKLYIDKYNFNTPNIGSIKMDSIQELSKHILKKDKDKSNIELNSFEINTLRRINYSHIKEQFENLEYDITSFKLKQNGPMVIGLGNQSVNETSMTFHHTYGIPYIPAQAIKGVVRNYIIINHFNCDENEALDDKGFKNIFGYTKDNKASKGKVIFFDAFPVNDKVKIEKDIMTVHYKEYYNKDNCYPTDDQEKNIIDFFTLEDSTFEFLLGYDLGEKDNKEDLIVKNNKEYHIEKLLKEALINMGIGAKTSVGYGYFKKI